MRWLIDGYNVIRRDPDLRAREAESLEAGRIALLRVVAGVARRSTDEFTIVFDGSRVSGAGTPGAGRVQVMFSSGREKADDVLMRLAARHGQGAIVVTSDRTVHDAARRSGAIALRAEEFLDGLTGDPGDSGDDDEPSTDRPKRGNARRLSKDARATRRAMLRLRQS